MVYNYISKKKYTARHFSGVKIPWTPSGYVAARLKVKSLKTRVIEGTILIVWY